MSHKLEVDSIQLNFGLKNVLSDVYIKCETGKITGLVGRNGEGKSCLMNVIYGSLETTSKSIRFDNISVFQAYKKPGSLLYLPQFNFIPKSLSLKRVFSDFNLPYSDFEKTFPEFQSNPKSSLRSLSGGERRLVEVYVIIKTKSQFAMLDEPFSHLMPLQMEKVKELLMEEKNTKGFLVTDHMYKQIIDICDYLYVLKDGKAYLTKDIMDIETLGYARL